jgi:hypothetical protein
VSSSEAAELSSLATALEDIAGRVASMAERASGTEKEALAADLFEVERTLREALRRLGRVTDQP